VAERRGARLVTQRQLQVEGPPPAPSSEPPAPSQPSPDAPTPSTPVHPPRDPSLPIPPSNADLLERQQKWLRERSKFDTHRSSTEPTG